MKYSHATGIRLMIQAAAAFSLMAVCVKTASRSLPSMEIVFFRSILGCALTLACLRIKRESAFGSHRWQLVLRGTCGFLALAFFFYALAHMPLGTGVLLNYTSPVFVLLLSPLFLKEKIPFWLMSLALLCFGGLVLLTEAAVDIREPYFACAMLSSFFAAVSYMTIRTIRGRESAFTIMFYFTLISTLGSFALSAGTFRWPDSMSLWLILLGAGVWAFAGQYWLTLAIHHAPASLVSPFAYVTPVLSYLYGLVFWGETLSAREFLGVVLIITGGCLISYFSGKQQKAFVVAPAEEESI